MIYSQSETIKQRQSENILHFVVLLLIENKLGSLTRIGDPHMAPQVQVPLALSSQSIDQRRSASSTGPTSSSRWSPPWSLCVRQAAWRVGSQGRRAHPAAPWTPVSSGPWSTWDRNLTRSYNCLIMIDKFIFAFSSPPPSVASLRSKFPKSEASHWKVGVLSFYLFWCRH